MKRATLAVLAALVVTGVTAPGTASTPASPSPSASPDPARSARVTAERVFVETTVDTDHDGAADRIAVSVTRPTSGRPLPAIVTMSPYRHGLNPAANHDVDVPLLPQESLRTPRSAGRTDTVGRRAPLALPVSLRRGFLAHGYAVVVADSLGTGGSDGCPGIGDATEAAAGVAIIDWLNGRAPGFDEAGDPVTADWANGRVGMTGTSYDGSLANMVAATGVRGLRAIVPIAAIASWYDYYRSAGLVVAPGGYQGEDTDVMSRAVVNDPVACAGSIDRLQTRQDRVSGDFGPFWRRRSLLADAGRLRAAVFVVHGHADWNVKGQNYQHWWRALTRADVPRKIWLHRGAHALPTRPDFQRTMMRWMDRWVKGTRNGIMTEPRVDLEVPGIGWRTAADWPDPQARLVRWRLAPGRDRQPGRLVSRVPTRHAVSAFTDNGRRRTARDLAGHRHRSDPNRLVYVTRPLRHAAVLTGAATVSLALSVEDRADANVTALLVDYGRRPRIITRGWIDPQNRQSIAETAPLVQGRRYRLRLHLQPKEYRLRRGHRIGLVVISTDHAFTLRPRPGTTLGLATRPSTVAVRVVVP